MTHDHPDDDNLSRGLRIARTNLALKERIERLQRQLTDDWERHRTAVISDAPTGLSPVAELHLDALATIAVLSNFHCQIAHGLIEQGDHAAAHSWTLDEGMLNAAFELLSRVDVTDC